MQMCIYHNNYNNDNDDDNKNNNNNNNSNSNNDSNSNSGDDDDDNNSDDNDIYILLNQILAHLQCIISKGPLITCIMKWDEITYAFPNLCPTTCTTIGSLGMDK